MPYIKRGLLVKLLAAGQQMSNVCFNWKQCNRFTSEERNMLTELQEKWDSTAAEVRDEDRKRS